MSTRLNHAFGRPAVGVTSLSTHKFKCYEPVVGRKNFYGNHSDRAAQATAIFYSVIATGKLHKIDLKQFLKRYFMTCAQSERRTLSKDQIESFLPHKYAQLHPEDKVPW